MGNYIKPATARRSFLAQLATILGVLGATSPDAGAGAGEPAAPKASNARWSPARHEQDDWYNKIPGVHRLMFDTTSPDGMALGLRFANNYFNASRTAYGLNETELAVLIVARHKATAFGYNDAMWAKYGEQFSEQTEFVDPKTKQPPNVNYFARPDDGSSEPTAGAMAALIEKNVHFAVCATATRNIAGRVAKSTGGDVNAIVTELGANLICPNARLVAAGIVAVNRAQEHGYSFVGPG